MLSRLLQKIQWKVRKWNIKFSLLDIFLHDGNSVFGFSLFEIIYNYTSYSLLTLEFRLPNGADRKVAQLTHWDFLFLSKYCFTVWERLDDRKMWQGDLTKWDEFKLRILNKLIK